MQIKKLVVAATKGGTGKSTISTSIAACLACSWHKDVMLLDADKQGTSKRWVDRRNASHPNAPRIHVAQALGDVMQPMNDFAGRYDYVICDVGCGEDNPSLRSAIVGADIVLMPIRGSMSDLETAETMNGLIKLARGFNPSVQAYAVLNMAPTNTHILHESVSAREFLSEFEQIVPLDMVVSDRKVFRDAMLQGLSVAEMSNSQARAEIELLTQTIFFND